MESSQFNDLLVTRGQSALSRIITCREPYNDRPTVTGRRRFAVDCLLEHAHNRRFCLLRRSLYMWGRGGGGGGGLRDATLMAGTSG